VWRRRDEYWSVLWTLRGEIPVARQQFGELCAASRNGTDAFDERLNHVGGAAKQEPGTVGKRLKG
jgi:hypothetical protein